jgi:hypothetical protein
MNPSKARDPDHRQRQDSAPVAAWRERMATEATIAACKDRAATIETVNADLKAHRGLDRLQVRGIGRVTCALLWSVLAYSPRGPFLALLRRREVGPWAVTRPWIARGTRACAGVSTI